VPARRLLVRVVAAGLTATALVAIAVLVTRSFDDMSWRILGTTTTISLCALLSVPASTLLERKPRSILGRASGALTLVTFVLTVYGIWAPWQGATMAKVWGIIATLTLAAAQGAGVEVRRRESDTPGTRALVRGSAVTGALLAALGVYAILAEVTNGTFYRWLAALAVLDLLLVVIPGVLRRGSAPRRTRYRVRVDGTVLDTEGRDFAAAVANAIRRAERTGGPVQRIERV
jgi:hypothetical protein